MPLSRISNAAGELAFAGRNISSRSASTSLIWRNTSSSRSISTFRGPAHRGRRRQRPGDRKGTGSAAVIDAQSGVAGAEPTRWPTDGHSSTALLGTDLSIPSTYILLHWASLSAKMYKQDHWKPAFRRPPMMWSTAARSVNSRCKLPSTKARFGFSRLSSASGACASSIRPSSARPATT
jgi:hypothetical protein